MPMPRIVAFALSLALHLLLALATLRHAPLPTRPPSPSPARPAITFFVPPADDEKFPGVKPLETVDENTGPARTRRAPRLTLDQFTFNVAKVADRAHVLFPFLTPGISWDHLPLVPETNRQKSLENPFKRTASAKKREPANPLVLEGLALQAMVDKAWSRRDRWKAFQPIISLADGHDADVGDLPQGQAALPSNGD